MTAGPEKISVFQFLQSHMRFPHDGLPINSTANSMKYPNLRYGNPTELAHYAMGIPLADLARILRRDERTVRDWLSGKQRVPWWVPEYMRLRRMESIERARQMNMSSAAGARLGVVRDDVIELATRRQQKAPQITDLRRDDFDPISNSR